MYNNMNEAHRHGMKQKKPDTKEYVLYDYIFMHFQNR